MNKTTAARIQENVIKMYEAHPFPSVAERAEKAEAEMAIRLRMLAIRPEHYVAKRVLDAGCGTGEYSCWYARRGAIVTAVDLSAPSLKVASDCAERERLDNIAFYRESVLELPFAAESFDYVYSMGVLHHTPDPYKGFLELCRVLKPGGVVMVSLYNRFGRLRHNIKQRIVNSIAGEDEDKRVHIAKRLFPGTCRALKRNRHDDSDVIIYDAFGIPHESQHTAGEILRWFDRNGIDYMGAFGPLTILDNLRALNLMQRGKEYHDFRRFFDGYSLGGRAIDILPKLVDRFMNDTPPEELRIFSRPSPVSRAFVQFIWFCLGFRFSIFSLSGRKA